MRIVLFGCQKIALDVLEFLLTTEHEVVGVITHDEERDKIFDDRPVSEFCFTNGIPTLRFDKKVNVELIKPLRPDIIFSVYYRKILPKEIIDLPKLGCINIHPGILEANRGPNPTLYNVLRGDKYAGTTLHFIDKGMDTGNIIAQDSMLVEDRTGFELNRSIMKLGYELFVDNFNAIVAGTNHSYAQDHTKATCNVKFTNNMRYIDWCQPAEDIVNHIRAYARPYGCSISRTSKSSDIFIEHGEALDIPRSSNGPGSFEVSEEGPNYLVVQTYTKPLRIRWTAANPVAAGVIVGRKKGRFISGVPE